MSDFLIKTSEDDEDEKCPPERTLERIPEPLWGTIDKIMAIRLKSDQTSEAISATIPSYTHPPTAKEHDLRKFMEVKMLIPLFY